MRPSVADRMRAMRTACVRLELGEIAESIPSRFLPTFVNFNASAEHVHILASLIGPPPRRLLIVGTAGGRDFWGLRARGYDVVGMNLTPDDGCPPTVVADAEQPWPFPDEHFDAVIAGEVLEHLIDDHTALREARRVLRPTGSLIVTVPFLHDSPEYHVRVHTRKSIARLVRSGGFRVERLVERPGLPLKRLVTISVTAVNLARALFGARSRFLRAATLVGEVELRLGERRSVLRSALGRLGVLQHGGTVLAHPTDRGHDYKELNRVVFR